MKKAIKLVLALTIIIYNIASISDQCFGVVNKVENDYVKSSVLDVAQKTKENWVTLDQKWPGLKYATNKLIILDLDIEEKIKRGWVVGTEGAIELKAAELKGIEAPSVLGYNALQFKGMNAIVIAVEESNLKQINQMLLEEKSLSSNFIYTVGTHEMVHFYYQSNLKRFAGDESRATVYPLSDKPRVYRKMVMLKLINAYQAKTERQMHQYLSEAKYWNEKWKNEFKNESDNIYQTDLIEGHARYIEYMAENKQLNAITRTVFSVIRNKTYMEVDGESYELGFLSGLLLDKQNPKWKLDYLKNGIRPVDLLLKPYKAKENPIDKIVQNRYRQEIEQSNQQIKLMISDILKSDKNYGIPYLRVNSKNLVGSYKIDKNVVFNNKDVYLNMSFKAKMGNSHVNVDGLSVFEEQSAQDEAYYYIPLTMPYELDNNMMVIKSNSLNVLSTVDLVNDDNGRKIYTTR